MAILKAEERIKNSVHSARRERRSGKVPGVIYGSHIKNFLFEIGELELNREISQNGEHGTIDLEINNKEHRVLIKEIQKDPVTHKILHIDFQEVNRGEIVQTEVPIVFIGEELAARGGNIVQKEKSSIKVTGKCEYIPSSLNVDLSNMHVGDVFRLADMEIAKEITFSEDMDTVLAVVSPTSTSKDAENDDLMESEINGTTDEKIPTESK